MSRVGRLVANVTVKRHMKHTARNLRARSIDELIDSGHGQSTPEATLHCYRWTKWGREDDIRSRLFA
jgi:hypothetical protein